MLRLGQSRTIRGRAGETSRGLKDLDCDTCSKQLQRARGCHRFGQSWSGPEWLFDYTGDLSQDLIRWCPASIRDVAPPSFFGALSRALRVEVSGGALAAYGTPHFLMPAWWVSFFEASIAARDRFLRDLDNAHHEVS